jgi:hypothetical protein
VNETTLRGYRQLSDGALLLLFQDAQAQRVRYLVDRASKRGRVRTRYDQWAGHYANVATHLAAVLEERGYTIRDGKAVQA